MAAVKKVATKAKVEKTPAKTTVTEQKSKRVTFADDKKTVKEAPKKVVKPAPKKAVKVKTEEVAVKEAKPVAAKKESKAKAAVPVELAKKKGPATRKTASVAAAAAAVAPVAAPVAPVEAAKKKMTKVKKEEPTKTKEAPKKVTKAALVKTAKETKAAPKKETKAAPKKEAKVAVKKETEGLDSDDSDDEEALTEEQESELRKKVLGDLASDSEGEDSSEDEEDDKASKPDTFAGEKNVIALSPEGLEQSKVETKALFDKHAKGKKLSKAKQEAGVVYLGRIPHGFFEKEMLAYFSQFGDVNRLRLSRNKKTGRSKHFAFIEFASSDVAQIVADTMNNYLLFEHMLKCHVVPAEKVHEKAFEGADKKFKVIPWKKIAAKNQNKERTPEQKTKQLSRLQSRQEKRQERLQKLGITYDLPKFA